MNSIPVLASLIVNRGDLLLRLVESIDYPVDKFVIVDNGNDPGVKEAIDKLIAERDNVEVFRPGKNLGVAGGWNWVMKNYEAPWWFIAGNDVKFTPGDMEKLAAEAWNKHETVGKFFGNQGHNAYIITKFCVDKAGYYDENFYPAYLEDCDHMYRMQLTGVPAVNVQDCNIIHGEAPSWGSTTIYSNPHFRVQNGITHGIGFYYYKHKWGGVNAKETYKHPHNDEKNDPKDWELSEDIRKGTDIWGI